MDCFRSHIPKYTSRSDKIMQLVVQDKESEKRTQVPASEMVLVEPDVSRADVSVCEERNIFTNLEPLAVLSNEVNGVLPYNEPSQSLCVSNCDLNDDDYEILRSMGFLVNVQNVVNLENSQQNERADTNTSAVEPVQAIEYNADKDNFTLQVLQSSNDYPITSEDNSCAEATEMNVTEDQGINSYENDQDYIPSESYSDTSTNEEPDVFHQVTPPNEIREKRPSRREKLNTKSETLKDKKFSVKKRMDKFKKRNAGLAYMTLDGKMKRARIMKPIGVCRAKCKDKLSEEVRRSIFEEYWALGHRDKRAAFVSSLVDSIEPSTTRKRTDDPEKEKFRLFSHKFHFKVEGKRIPVCRGCFTKTLDETNMFITLSISSALRSKAGVTADDQRGKEAGNRTSSDRIQEVRKHIRSFPAYQSHYTRRTNDKKYLPPFLNLTILYDLYKNSVSNPVSRGTYLKELRSMKIAFKSPKVDTCHKCDSFAIKMKIADAEEKSLIQTQIDHHHKEADDAYLKKKEDKIKCSNDNTKKCYTFDLQQCLPTPHVNSSVSFYKRHLWTYNFTLYECNSENVRCFMWHEAEGGRGANQIATCIYKELSQLSTEVKHIVLYSDSCGGQNRNSHVAVMFLTLMQQKEHFETIDHKFMVSGHSHLECDVHHSLIERQKKMLQTPIYHPYDWYQLVRSVGKKVKFQVTEMSHEDFLNFSGLLKTKLFVRKKDTDGNSFKWTDIRWLRYTRKANAIQFKMSLDENEPFRSLDLTRRNVKDVSLNPEACYKETLSISAEKKKDLLDLLPLINPVFHDFYKNLKVTNKPDTLPGLDDFPDE